MQNPGLVAQAQGFIRSWIEIQIEEGRPGAEQALEWFVILDQGVKDYRVSMNDAQSRIQNAKIALG